MEKAEEKLRSLANEAKVTLLLPCVSLSTPHEIGKAQYLEERLQNIDNVKTMKLVDIEYEGVHPTEEGTRDIITQLDNSYENKLILQEAEKEEISTPRRYSQVQALYKVGCRGCDVKTFTAKLCNSCKDKAAEINITRLGEIIETLENQFYPHADFVNEALDDDVEMTENKGEETSGLEIENENMNEVKKRLHTGNDEHKNSKSPRHVVE